MIWVSVLAGKRRKIYRVRMEGVEKEDAAVEWKKKYDTLKEESETLKILSARGSHSWPQCRALVTNVYYTM